jgi:hypothetical protein
MKLFTFQLHKLKHCHEHVNSPSVGSMVAFNDMSRVEKFGVVVDSVWQETRVTLLQSPPLLNSREFFNNVDIPLASTRELMIYCEPSFVFTIISQYRARLDTLAKYKKSKEMSRMAVFFVQ